MYDTYQRRIAECDQQLQKHLASFADTELPQSPKAESKEKRAKSTKNAPRFDLSSELKRITGVDLTRIDGIDVMVAQTLLRLSGHSPNHEEKWASVFHGLMSIPTAGCPQGHHCYGSPPRTTRLSYAEVRSTIRRQRD
jgi:hypothetical protein